MDKSSGEQNDAESIAKAYEKCSEVVNRVMLSLLGVAMFCVFTILAVPDRALIASEPPISVPLVNVHVSFAAFLIVAPLLLIVLITYLHLFFGHWLELEEVRQRLNVRASVATLFSLDRPWAHWLTTLIFYWLVAHAPRGTKSHENGSPRA
jgi:hypothetical protein